MNNTAAYFVEKLSMQLHPEGGWFKETYRSKEVVLGEHLPNRFGDARHFSTGIYFLLEGKQFSAFHKIKSDEMWHFYYGSPLNVYVINEQAQLQIIKLGNNLEAGEEFQAVVKAGCWFASKPANENTFCLVGCTVSPGFDFQDFEMAKRDELLIQYPHLQPEILMLTR